jgi:hypothetical protein
MDKKVMRKFRRFMTLALGALLVTALSSIQLRAQERLCDTAFEDCRAPLWSLIDAETVGIDVAFWFMQDTSYATKLINKHNQGVRVRVLVDPRANPIYNGNQQVLDMLQGAGIPMRYNVSEGILHWKMMLFAGQNKVEFSGANFSPAFFVPTTPNSNYIDEAIYFTDDPSVVNSFKTRYDDLWTNTTRYANYANITTPLTRRYPIFPIDPELNWSPDTGDSEFANRAVYAYTAEPQKIDVIMYRITDQRHTNAMIAAVARGVPVRLLTEPNEYRNPDKFWHSWNVDRMYMAGVQVKNRNPQRLGLNHEKVVMLYGQKTTIFGSSNWTTSSSVSQEEHNYFTRKQWVFDWFVNQFERKWNSTSENSPFVPQPPPNPPAYSLPQNGALGLTNVTLQWEGGLWAHKYDIYFGTNPNPPLIASDVNTGSPYPGNPETYPLPALAQGTTYYWRIVAKTMADLGTSGPTWSFTTAGTEAPPAAPTVLSATAISTTQINLSWNDVANETAYRVERSPNGSANWSEIGTLQANQSTFSDLQVSAQTTYFYRVRASNSGGFSPYSNIANATTPAPPAPSGSDIVLWASEAPVKIGNWSVVADASAAGGSRLSNPDAGAPKKTQPSANPSDYFEMTFNAQAGVNYRIWIRGKAQNDFWGNDSVFIQFSDSVDSGGSPVYRIGNNSAAEVNLEDCSGCGLQSWGWQDNGWGVGVLGPLLRFQATGSHTLRIQVKEDGLSIDQIVISPQTYLNSAPGSLKNDATILAKSNGSSAPAPSVSSISPTSGSTSGGTAISISGGNFAASATVSIGGAAATNVTVVNSGSITATTSARSAGTVNVTVINASGQSGTLTNGYTYVAPPSAPTVTNVTPSSGSTAGGTSVTISGTNFQANALVTIGGTSATNVAVLNGTTITALTPAHAAGAVDVVVTNTDGQSGTRVLGFTYATPQTTVPSFDRVFVVVAENQSFSDVIGGASMPYLNKLADRYGLAVNYYGNTHPSIGDYFWLTTGQNITNDSNFTGTVTADNIVRQLNIAGKTWKSYAQSLPSIGYTGGDAYPYVKRHNPFAYLSDVLENPSQANNLVGLTQFTSDLANNQFPNYSFIIPDQQNNGHDCPAGIPNCTNADKLASADNWLKTHIDPVIASASFRQGGLLIITFDESVNSDTQNGGGHVATVVISSKAKQGFESTSLYQHQSTLRTMAESLGLTSFPGAAATAPNMSEFFGPTPNTAPGADTVSPSSGPVSGGTAVTISGTGFATGATVNFGGSLASATVVGSTTINAITPAHASGPVTVTVTNPGGQGGNLTNGYVYASAPPPSVSSITPNSGPTAGGSSVTISGGAFVAGATVSIGGVAATNVNVSSSTTITATTAAHAAGTVNVVVTNPDAQSATLTNGFTFNAPSGGETVLLADDFNDGALNSSKWVANNLFSGFTDTTVVVRETQQLEIGPLKQNVDGSHYNGIKSASAFNFAGSYVQVQIVQPSSATTAADAFFTIGLDVNNCYRLYVEGGTLFLQTKFNGVKNHPFTAAFDPVNHAFWRIRHDALTGNLIFETAPANAGVPGTWTQRHVETWNASSVPLNNVLFELKAGTWRIENNSPGTVSFDNFKAARP